MQNELAMAGKHDASMEEIRTFVQRRCQYAQLIPSTTAQPFNQISAPKPNVAVPQSSNSQPTENRETKRKFDGQCRHCGITGHKWVECRKRLREEAQNKTSTNNQQEPTTTNPTHQYPRRQTQIQSQTDVPDMWQSGTLRPRLLLQKYDDISLPKRPVFEAVDRREQPIPPGF